MSRWSNRPPQLQLSLWRTDGQRFYADLHELRAAMDRTGESEAQIAERLGSGRAGLESLLRGGGVNAQTALLIEWALLPKEIRMRWVLRPQNFI